MTANFYRYARFVARRERVASLVWIAALTLSFAGIAAMYPGLFPTKESLLSLTATLNTPAMVAMMGPVYGLERINPAIAMSQECLQWFAIAMAVMNIFFVNRHTRVDEELGRHEMLASLPVGRLTGSAAVITAAFVLDVAISLLSAIGIIILKTEGVTATGALVYTFSIGMQGFVFAAITLLAAQLFSTARGCIGSSFALLGLSYVMRASGDMSGNVLSAISPMGLGLKVEAFYTNAFWPIAALLAEGVVITLVALVVNTRRDVGAGIFAARKGKQNASRFLQSPFGFAWRLSCGSFIAWAVAFLVLGAMYGTVIGELDSFVKGNDMIRQMIESQGATASLAEAFLPMLCGIMAMLAAIPVIGAITRLRIEEKRGRMEQIYARAVSRAAMFASFATIAVVEAAVFTLLSTVGLYATSQSTGLLSLKTLAGAAFVYLPAILTLAGVAAVLVGLLPKLISLTWALVCYAFLMMYFGRLFDVPQWAVRISPFGNVPQLPVQEFRAAPLVALCVIAFALTVAGYFAGYRRRDIAA